MVGHGAKFGHKVEQAIAALLSHRNVEEAARAVGISANTLLRWLKEPEFEAACREARRTAFSQSIARLQDASGAAVSYHLPLSPPAWRPHSPPSPSLRQFGFFPKRHSRRNGECRAGAPGRRANARPKAARCRTQAPRCAVPGQVGQTWPPRRTRPTRAPRRPSCPRSRQPAPAKATKPPRSGAARFRVRTSARQAAKAGKGTCGSVVYTTDAARLGHTLAFRCSAAP